MRQELASNMTVRSGSDPVGATCALLFAVLACPVAASSHDSAAACTTPGLATSPTGLADDLRGTPEPFGWEGPFQQIQVCYPSRQSGAQQAGYFFAPVDLDERLPFSLPVVVIGPGSGTGRAYQYLWAARELAANGYIALVSDPQGAGSSQVVGDPARCVEAGCPGVPYQQASNYVDNFASGIDFMFSLAHPWLLKADLAKVGIAGHSLSARAASYVQGIDQRITAAVAWDNNSSTLEGDKGVSSGGGTCGSVIGGEVTLASRPVTPRVPILGEASDATPGCDPTNTDPEIKKTGYNVWRQAGVPSMQVVLKGAGHTDFSQTSSSNPAEVQMFQHYTRAWFDLFLKGDIGARERLLTHPILGKSAEQILSSTFHSAVFLPDAQVDCPELLPGICVPRAALRVRLPSGAALPAGVAPLTPVVLDASASSVVYPTDPIVSYTFDFGDGSPLVTQSEPTIVHAYRNAGSYTPAVTVADGHGLTGSAAAAPVVVTGPAITVTLAANPASANVKDGPVQVTFTADARDSDPNGGALSYTFYYGDGTRSERQASPASTHAYAAAGVYQAYVIVADANLNSATSAPVLVTMTTTLTVEPNDPVRAVLDVALSGSVAPVTASFDGSRSQAPDGAIYAFDFGDGQPAQAGGATGASHVYTTSGVFTARMTVTDKDDPANTSTATASITITAAQVTTAQLVVSPTTVTVGKPVAFDASASIAGEGTAIRSYTFDFGDGDVVTRTVAELGGEAARIAHVYLVPGTYQPALTVSDDQSGTAQAKALVSVQSHPSAPAPAGGGGAMAWLALLALALASLRRHARARWLVGLVLLGSAGLSPAAECDSAALNPNDAQNPALGEEAAVLGWEGEYVQADVCYPSRQSGAQLHAYLYAPKDIDTRSGPLPLVVIGPGSGNGRAKNYMWAGRTLAGHGGYLALVYDPQGNGESEVNGDAESCDAEGCPGVPFQSADNFVDGFLSTIDFAYTRDHAWLQKADLARGVGIAGHSLSARAGAYVSGIDERVSVLVAWDNLSSTLEGDAGISSGGGACGSVIGGEPPGESQPVTPRVPAMGQASDAPPSCDSTNTDPDVKKTAYNYWRDAGQPVMQLVFRDSAHGNWSQTSSSDPADLQLFEHYTRAWFDLFLKGDPSARERLLTRAPLDRSYEEVLSVDFRSAAFLPAADVDCGDLLTGCGDTGGAARYGEGRGVVMGALGWLVLLPLVVAVAARRLRGR